MNKLNYWVAPAIKENVNSVENVINTVCKHFEISKKQLRSKCRLRKYVDARSIIGYILTNNSNLTLNEIGYLLNRHHASVLHYNGKVTGFIQFDKNYKELVNKFL